MGAMDESREGTITLGELRKTLRARTSRAIGDDQIDHVFDALDGAADKEIHYTEFLAAMVSTRIQMNEELLKSTFQRFDCDNSGYITPANLKEVLGESFHGASVQQLIDEADFKRDGRISYAEFLQYLQDADIWRSSSKCSNTSQDKKLRALRECLR